MTPHICVVEFFMALGAGAPKAIGFSSPSFSVVWNLESINTVPKTVPEPGERT